MKLAFFKQSVEKCFVELPREFRRRSGGRQFILSCVGLQTPWARIIVLGLGIFFLAVISLKQLHLPDLCLIKKIFGFCPACGITRALICFFKGNIAESMKYNGTVLLVGPLLIFIFLKDCFTVIRKKQ